MQKFLLLLLMMLLQKKDQQLNWILKIYNQLKTGLKSIKISNFGIKNNKKRTKYQIVLKLKEDKNLKLNKLKILNKIEKIKKIKNYKKHLITLDIDP